MSKGGWFIEVDNNEVVKLGDLKKNSEAIKMVKPNFDPSRTDATDANTPDIRLHGYYVEEVHVVCKFRWVRTCKTAHIRS